LRIDGLRPLLAQLRQSKDLIIVDCPALFHDATLTNVLALTDATLLVIDAQRGQSSAVLQAKHWLTTMGINFTVLLNRAESEFAD
jgi:Mrp family chromosome partitioning ATPase